MDQPVAVHPVAAPPLPERALLVPAPLLPAPLAWTVALGGAVLAGMLTSVGQAAGGFVATLSNAPGPWLLVAAALVLVARPRLGWAMVLGVAALELMHVGYFVTTVLRGYPDSLSAVGFWEVVAVPAGVLAGLAATWVRRPGWRRSVATGLVAAALIGEDVSSLLRVAATTSVSYWVVELCVGVGLTVLGMAAARSAVDRVLTLGTALVGTAAVLGASLVLGG